MADALLIVGAGGHGKVIADAALLQQRWAQIAFLDDNPSASELLGLEVIDGSTSLRVLRERFNMATAAVGDADKRLAILADLERAGFALPPIRHPSAVISPHTRIEPGCVLLANCVLNADSRLGQGCILNTAASVDHDCVLGTGVHVAPGARVAGGVTVGDLSWIGIGASVKEYVAIGERVTVGAGAVVVADIGNDATVRGVPARGV